MQNFRSKSILSYLILLLLWGCGVAENKVTSSAITSASTTIEKQMAAYKSSTDIGQLCIDEHKQHNKIGNNCQDYWELMTYVSENQPALENATTRILAHAKNLLFQRQMLASRNYLTMLDDLEYFEGVYNQQTRKVYDQVGTCMHDQKGGFRILNC